MSSAIEGMVVPKELLSINPIYNKATRLRGSTVVISDVQIPFQDGEFLYKVLHLANKWGVKQGISAGDFFNQSAFSIFLHRPEDKLWKEEATAAQQVASVMLSLIPNWLFLLGNHDAFLLKTVAHQFGHDALMRLADMPTGIESSDYYWCIVEDGRGNEWRVTHPRNISVIHARVPQRLAARYQQNVIASHGHLIGMTPDDSGKFCCIDEGVCCDPLRLDYSMERDSTRPAMNQGAVILKETDGLLHPYLLHPKWTDFEALEKAYG